MNKKTKFFKNVLLLQFIPILLLGILILSNFREQKILKIRQLHPYEFNYGYAIPLFVFGIGLVLALFSLFSKQEDISQDDEAEILKIKRRQNFWKFAFYCNVFFVAVIAIFSVLIFLEEPLAIDQAILFYSFIFSRSLLVVVISLVTASFLLAAGINWKINKTLAVTVLIFSFFIIGISCAGELIFVNKFNTASEEYNNAKNEKKSLGNEEVESEDYTESVESEENYEGEDEGESEDVEKEPLEIDKSKLLSSLEYLMENWFGEKPSHIREFSYARIYISTNLQQGEDDTFYLLNYMENLKDRPKELTAGFDSYKTILYNTVSAETYRSAGFDKVVEKLLLTYEDIGAESEKLNKIYQVMEMDPADESQSTIGAYLPGLEKYCSSYTLRKLKSYKDFSSYDSDIVWFYSFWARRNREGNINEIASILKQIKEHYN